jgi:cytidyltransferase-like protein
MKIGLIPMSAKPYHAGHHFLVELARRECDGVYVFVSSSSRQRAADEAEIQGEAMRRVWDECILPVLPCYDFVENTKVHFVDNPITAVYRFLGVIGSDSSSDVSVNIYGDATDVPQSFPRKMLEKHHNNLLSTGRLTLRGLDRGSTVDISGTRLRRALYAGDKATFLVGMPKGVDGERVWQILGGQ